MNKIIPIISVLVLCGCSTKQIKTSDASINAGESAKSSLKSAESRNYRSPAKPVSTTQSSSSNRHLIANRSFRHHTILSFNKPAGPAETAKKESLIPRIARYIKQGIASWYGPRFHGKKTATGEIFDMYAMTAAHKTLPIPSYAQVTNLENNRSVIVRINDRGPYVGNRLLDLSYAAAKKLGIHKEGLGKVEIVALSDDQALPQIRNDENEQDKGGRFDTFKSSESDQRIHDKITVHHDSENKILPFTYQRSAF